MFGMNSFTIRWENQKLCSNCMHRLLFFIRKKNHFKNNLPETALSSNFYFLFLLNFGKNTNIFYSVDILSKTVFFLTRRDFF